LSLLLLVLPAAVVFDGMWGLANFFVPWLIALYAAAVLSWIALAWAHRSPPRA
jgi:hypothetical protein